MQTRKKVHSNAWIYVVTILLLIIAGIAGGAYYYYNEGKKIKEREVYSAAMESSDVEVLQNYLDMYESEAPKEHIDNIQSKIEEINRSDEEWRNASVSQSRTLLQKFVQNYPNSQHRLEAEHKIDSLDWIGAFATKTLEALQKYVSQHADGEHIDEAASLIENLKNGVVSDKDIDFVKNIFNEYFGSISSKNERSLLSTVSGVLSSFLGKNNANKNDVLAFLRKIYSGDVLTSNWTLNDDFTIEKQSAEDGLGGVDYTVKFSVDEKVESLEGSNKVKTYKVTAKIDKYGKISEFNMEKPVEE